MRCADECQVPKQQSLAKLDSSDTGSGERQWRQVFLGEEVTDMFPTQTGQVAKTSESHQVLA